MGMNRYVYIGPYIEFDDVEIKEVDHLEGVIDHVLYRPGDHKVLICNGDVNGRLSHHDKHDEPAVRPFTDKSLIVEEYIWFGMTYKKELDLIAVECTKAFTLKWGVITFDI